MKVYEKASTYDLFEDMIMFRSLNALNPKLPRFTSIKEILGINELPRKVSLDYAKVINYLNTEILPGLNAIVYLGDSDLDKTVIKNLKGLTDKKLYGYIYNQKTTQPYWEDDYIYISGQWSGLVDFFQRIESLVDKNCRQYQSILNIYAYLVRVLHL